MYKEVYTRTGHKGPDGEQRYSFTLSLTLALDNGGSKPRPGHFTPGKETQYPLYRKLDGPQDGLDGCGKSRPHRDSIHGQNSS